MSTIKSEILDAVESALDGAIDFQDIACQLDDLADEVGQLRFSDVEDILGDIQDIREKLQMLAAEIRDC